MSNSRYTAGRRAEYEARDILLSEGWPVVVRAAGSKGAADLVAVKESSPFSCRLNCTMCTDMAVLFVSVKSGRGRATKAERERLAALPGRRELWTRKPKGVWLREVIQ